jgi:hypothetical protein
MEQLFEGKYKMDINEACLVRLCVHVRRVNDLGKGMFFFSNDFFLTLIVCKMKENLTVAGRYYSTLKLQKK